MDERSRSRRQHSLAQRMLAQRSLAQQSLVRILLAVNLLICLLVVGVLDHAASAQERTLLWVSGGSLLALMAPLFWLAKRARGGAERDARPAETAASKGARWVLVLILLLAAGLRFYHLGQEGFWFDEVWTAEWADQSLARIMQIVNPLSYLVSHVMLRVGRSEFVLRSTSAFAGVLAVAALYLLGRTLYGRREGLVAAALLAFSAYAIYHSQELRYYAWQMLFSALSLYLLLQGLHHNRARDWAAFTVCTVLSIYNFPLALFVLASEGLYVVTTLTWDLALAPAARTNTWGARLRALGGRLVGPAASAISALVLYAPQWSSVFWFHNPEWVPQLVTAPPSPGLGPSPFWGNSPFAFWIFGVINEHLGFTLPSLLFFWLLGLVVLGLVASRRRTALLSLLWVGVPLPVLLFMGMRVYPRHLCHFVPLLLVVMAHGITFLAQAFTRRPKAQTMLLFALTALGAAPSLLRLPAYYTEPQKDQWRELTAQVDARHQAGDLLLVNALYDLEPLPFDWYSTTPADELIRRPFPKGYILRYESELDQLGPLTKGYDRVWLIFCDSTPRAQTLIEDALTEKYEFVEEVQVEGLRLLLFESAVRPESK